MSVWVQVPPVGTLEWDEGGEEGGEESEREEGVRVGDESEEGGEGREE